MVQNIPSNVQQNVARVLNLKRPDELHDFSFSGGGCINPGGRLKTTAGTFFLKWNSAKKFPSMFNAEAKGLKLLRNANAIEIPAVIGTGEDDDIQFILLDFIEQGPQTILLERPWCATCQPTQNHYASVRARSRQLHRFASPI